MDTQSWNMDTLLGNYLSFYLNRSPVMSNTNPDVLDTGDDGDEHPGNQLPPAPEILACQDSIINCTHSPGVGPPNE